MAGDETQMMKVEYINPFIEASIKIFGTVANMELELGKIFLKQDPYSAETMLVMIGITGGLRGRVIISMDLEIALKVASHMMGMEVLELDELAQSAVMELCNMILGTASTILSSRELEVDITPPTLLIGSNMKIFSNQQQTICVPLTCEEGKDVELNITLS